MTTTNDVGVPTRNNYGGSGLAATIMALPIIDSDPVASINHSEKHKYLMVWTLKGGNKKCST